MKFAFCRWPDCLIAAFFFFSVTTFGAQYKPVRLRNQLDGQPIGRPLARVASVTGSGLFLVQFNQPPDREARVRLAAAGVELLHYVPQDTFLARVRSGRIEQVRTLPSVQWVSEYLPEHKVHKALRASAAKTKPVTVLRDGMRSPLSDVH